MALSSDEVNFLIYRYLLESGLTHSAFAFGHESHIAKSSINGEKVPTGALVSFIQKGLRYDEIEHHVSEDGTEVSCDVPFSVLREHSCNVKDKKRIFDPDSAISEDFGSLEITADRVSSLSGHKNMVCACSWHPQADILASSSADSTARVWNLSGVKSETRSSLTQTLVKEKGDGTVLTTGTLAGSVFFWDSEGNQVGVQNAHRGAVTQLLWSPNSQCMLSTGSDGRAAVWDARPSVLKHIGGHHGLFFFSSSCLDALIDASWKDDSVFATCSKDSRLLVHDLKSESPLAAFEEHSLAINSCGWNSSSTLLASGSDDCTVKVWKLGSDTSLQTLDQHGLEVVDLSWSPTSAQLLCSASFDTTARVWDVEAGECVQTLCRHLHPVSAGKYSPDGRYICTSANDRLYIWSPKNGSLLRTLKCAGGVNDFCWCPDSKRVGIATANNSVSVLDLRS